MTIVNGKNITPNIISQLLKDGANPNIASTDHITPLMNALDEYQPDNFKSITMLLQYGAKINAVDNAGKSALMQTDDLPTIDFLVSKGANLTSSPP